MLTQYQADNIVVDPVMVATSGSSLMQSGAVAALKTKLLTIATPVTPNIAEAEVLSGLKITDHDGMVEAAKFISESYGCAVLLKGATASTMPMTFCAQTVS